METDLEPHVKILHIAHIFPFTIRTLLCGANNFELTQNMGIMT